MQEINPMQGFEGTAKEATTAFREMAEKGIVQAKDNYAKMKTAAEEATSMMETTYANASKGVADYGLKMVEMARSNSNAAFDFAAELIGAKTLAQMVEISTSHTRKQIEQAAAQAKELAALAQKVATTTDRKSTRLNSSHRSLSRMPSSA